MQEPKSLGNGTISHWQCYLMLHKAQSEWKTGIAYIIAFVENSKNILHWLSHKTDEQAQTSWR